MHPSGTKEQRHSKLHERLFDRPPLQLRARLIGIEASLPRRHFLFSSLWSLIRSLTLESPAYCIAKPTLSRIDTTYINRLTFLQKSRHRSELRRFVRESGAFVKERYNDRLVLRMRSAIRYRAYSESQNWAYTSYNFIPLLLRVRRINWELFEKV